MYTESVLSLVRRVSDGYCDEVQSDVCGVRCGNGL